VVLINYLLPKEAFGLLMALVVATLLLNWIMICLAHLRFRAAMRRKGRDTQFKALLYPAGNYICIAFLGLILVLMCTMDDMRLSRCCCRCGCCSCLWRLSSHAKSSPFFSLSRGRGPGEGNRPHECFTPGAQPGLHTASSLS
jgi:L-asparagine transporter-like permease